MNERIRLLREELRLSRAAFGKKLGVSGDVVNNMERGRVDIKEHMIKLICSCCGVDEDWLRTGNGEMRITPKTDALEELIKQQDLSDGDRLLVEKFLRLEKEERQVVIKFLSSFAYDFASLASSTVSRGSSASDTEAGARAEAELYYEQRISEKKQESEVSFVKGSDVV